MQNSKGLAQDRRRPLARYGAIEGALRERPAPEALRHKVGHDPPTPSRTPLTAETPHVSKQ